jgi:PHD/YefM family antitoxin component YafN of YafNO toxin-antitoxin module
MRLQYLTDSNGNYTGVFIPIKEWERLKMQLNDYEIEEPEPTKEEILAGLKEAFKEVKQHEQGKTKLETLDELLDEL